MKNSTKLLINSYVNCFKDLSVKLYYHEDSKIDAAPDT